ncbi:MAG: hypothetical protein JXA66_04190 [Oligoflexia bacterium]|nr:hypothetical protein [Oligoflexia bacterium]
MIRIFGLAMLGLLLSYTCIAIFSGEEGLNLRLAIKSKSYSLDKSSRPVVLELGENTDSEYTFKNTKQIKLKGIFPARIPASADKTASNLKPVIKNLTTGDSAFVFMGKDGSFFTEYIQLVNGNNEFSIEYQLNNETVFSKKIKIKSI